MIPPPYINLAAPCEWIPYNGVAVGPACPPMRPPPPPHPMHLAPGPRPRPMHSTPGAHLRSGLAAPPCNCPLSCTQGSQNCYQCCNGGYCPPHCYVPYGLCTNAANNGTGVCTVNCPFNC